MELFFLLFGFAALFAFSGSISGGSDTEPPVDEDDERSGSEGNDIMFSEGGEILRGLAGDDTLVTSGDSTLLGGEGDDTLISYGGGALLNGGEGEDTFVINLLGVTDDSDLLDINGQPVEPTVIDDFNPDEDRLVLDPRNSGLLPEDDTPVTLTGVASEDGESLMVQVNGVDVVQLSNYGGEDMLAALGALDIEVLGAEYEFPTAETPIPAGVDIIEDTEFGNVLTFVVTNDFQGGGVLTGSQGVPDVLDLSEFEGDVTITTDTSGAVILALPGTDFPPTELVNIHNVILGPGTNIVDASGIPVAFEVTATGGTNTITGGDAGLTVALFDGENTVTGPSNGTVTVTIIGGENEIDLGDDSFGQIRILASTTGETTVTGGSDGTELRFVGSVDDLEVDLTEDGGAIAEWNYGRIEVETVGVVTVGNGALVDASARDVDSTVQIIGTGPDVTVIGTSSADILTGQGDFSGGAGDDRISIFQFLEGGAIANGGAGDDTLIARVSSDLSDDLVLTGADGTDSFVVHVDLLDWTGSDGVARITDLEDGETVRLEVTYYQFTAAPPPVPQIGLESDIAANEIRVTVNGDLVLVIENRTSITPDMLDFEFLLQQDFDDVAA